MAKPPPERLLLLGGQRNGWHLICHPAFREPLLKLAAEVVRLRDQTGPGWEDAPRAKLLKRILDIMLTEVPSDPASPRYEQGNTLGADARGWRRVKFLGRLRLFFRFDSASHVIVYAWLNDESTLRKAGSPTDPYTVFRDMPIAGDPPHDWNTRLSACQLPAESPQSTALSRLIGGLEPPPDRAPVTPRRPAGAAKRTR